MFKNKMGIAGILVLCSLAVGVVNSELVLEADRPYQSALVFETITLKCCYRGGFADPVWISRVRGANNAEVMHPVNRSDVVTKEETKGGILCSHLTFKSVQPNDTGLYQCLLKEITEVFTHGTYMQVYKQQEKTINLSESTKNSILTAEGVLLLLCVLLPSATLLFKSRRLKELQKKKEKREEENIYQGLNLDDCCTTYDQIERSQAHGPYQDVGNIMEEGEEILEKP